MSSKYYALLSLTAYYHLPARRTYHYRSVLVLALPRAYQLDELLHVERARAVDILRAEETHQGVRGQAVLLARALELADELALSIRWQVVSGRS